MNAMMIYRLIGIVVAIAGFFVLFNSFSSGGGISLGTLVSPAIMILVGFFIIYKSIKMKK